MTDTQTETSFLREKLIEKKKQSHLMVEAISRIMGLANSQENEPSLWFTDPVLMRLSPAQNALKALHEAIDNEWLAFADTMYPKL